MDKQKTKSLSSSNSESGTTAQSEERRISLNLSRRSFSAKPNIANTNSGEAESKASLAPQPSADKKSDDSQLDSKNQSTSQEPQTVPTALSNAPQTESSPSKLQFSISGKRQLNLRANAGNLASSNTQSFSYTESKIVTGNTNAAASKDTKKADLHSAKKNKATGGTNKESSKGSKVPPWMAQYQAKTEDNDTDEIGVHLDLTSKTKQEHLEQEHIEQEKAEKERKENSAQAAKMAETQKQLEQKQEQRLKSINAYQGFNSFDLDLLSFQKSFDSIDQKLSSFLDEHFGLLDQLMNNGVVPDYDELVLGADAVDLFTSKKSKYKRKSVLPIDALQKEIIDYLNFKHRGVFKAVCMYQFFCEQFRIELFSQLEKQCRAYTSSSNEVAMGDLQRMLDEIEPLDVAANKLIRFSLSEGKKILGGLQNYGRKADNEVCVERMHEDKHKSSEYSLIDKITASEKYVQHEAKELESFKRKFFTPNEVDLLDRVAELSDDDFVSYVSDVLAEKIAPNARDVIKEQGDAELYQLFPFLRCHLTNSNSIPDDSYIVLNDQLRRLSMALTQFEGYHEPQNYANPEVVDDCMLNTGFDWITSDHIKSLSTNKFEDWTCNIEWVFYWRLLHFLTTTDDDLFIDPDKCIQADSDYIFPCSEANFKRNLSQLNLLTRQLNGIRQIVSLSKGYGSKKLNFHADEYVNFTDNTVAVALQFIFSLEGIELDIFEEVLNKLSKCGEEDKLIFTVDEMVKLLVKNHNVADNYDTSVSVIEMGLKLIHSVLFEHAVSTVSMPHLMITHDFKFEAYASHMLIKNLESIKRMLKIRQSLKSIDKFMNRELLYLNPALRCLFECCESTSANRSSNGNILQRLDEFIKYEYYFNKLRNYYLESADPISTKIDKEVYLRCIQNMPGEFKQSVDLELFDAYLHDLK